MTMKDGNDSSRSHMANQREQEGGQADTNERLSRRSMAGVHKREGRTREGKQMQTMNNV
jgi:hypothetical protein